MSYYSGGNQTDASSVCSSHSRSGNNGAATPTGGSSNSNNNNSNNSNSSNNNNNGGFISSSLYSAFGGIMRRLSSDPNGHLTTQSSYQDHDHLGHAATFPASPTSPTSRFAHNNGINGVYTPPAMTRSASPMLLRPPPLEPLTLSGFSPDTPASARLLTNTVAEEIRIMVPERLRIEEDWKLAYSLDQDGASLATLYEKAARYDEHRIGFVLVVKDQDGGIFGAYLTEYPRPSSHYFGTGECFLWRAAVLEPAHYTTSRPPAPTQPSFAGDDLLIPGLDEASTVSPSYASSRQASSSTLASMATASAVSTQPPRSPPAQLVASPPRAPPSPSIRFNAYPYSGVNEYFIYCEAHSLSVGGGDGRYGLWLNDSLEKGISATCLTFGNQPLSDEGDKFGVLGVELWVIGSRR